MFEIIKKIEKYTALVTQLENLFPDKNGDGVPDVVGQFLDKFKGLMATYEKFRAQVDEVEKLCAEVVAEVQKALGVEGIPEDPALVIDATPPAAPEASPAKAKKK